MTPSKKQFDVNTLQNLISVVIKDWPQITQIIGDLLTALKSKQRLKASGAKAGKGDCPYNMYCDLCNHLQCQNQDLIDALTHNIIVQNHLDECCPAPVPPPLPPDEGA